MQSSTAVHRKGNQVPCYNVFCALLLDTAAGSQGKFQRWVLGGSGAVNQLYLLWHHFTNHPAAALHHPLIRPQGLPSCILYIAQLLDSKKGWHRFSLSMGEHAIMGLLPQGPQKVEAKC